MNRTVVRVPHNKPIKPMRSNAAAALRAWCWQRAAIGRVRCLIDRLSLHRSGQVQYRGARTRCLGQSRSGGGMGRPITAVSGGTDTCTVRVVHIQKFKEDNLRRFPAGQTTWVSS